MYGFTGGKLTPAQLAMLAQWERDHPTKVHNDIEAADMPEFPNDTWPTGGHDPVMIARH